MTDQNDPNVPDNDDDPVLDKAGELLRRESKEISPTEVETAVLRRRARRMSAITGTAIVVVLVLGGLLVAQRNTNQGPGGTSSTRVERLLASLDPQPVNPLKVKLVSTVSNFQSCDALIGDLRKVGARHVGSQGFGAYYGNGRFMAVGRAIASTDQSGQVADMKSGSSLPATGPPMGSAEGGDTLGTNVQVAGVDELDSVKAVGTLIYDLDGKGNLRVTDAKTLKVLSTLDVTPGGAKSSDRDQSGPYPPDSQPQVSTLLVAGGRVAVFGSESETSKPVKGDPSATQSSTSYMTVAFVDATDPAAPKLTDRVRIEGSLVSARLVEGQIRLVTTSNMAELGFVMPTTPNSVPKALEQNRRSVASSSAADWIPDWQRASGKPEPLVPCERVYVPDTFSGVAMTSMVTFPLGSGRFDPTGTSILAPGTTLYAGLDKVAISSEVWVDPIDQGRLKFKNWQTAIHEFSFAKDAAPAYEGSGIVDGSTVGQFAFGEIGKSLAVVTTKGVPWEQDPKANVDLTVLTSDGKGTLTKTSKIADLADGQGAVTAVRFIPGRVLISTGSSGQRIDVIDVTKPAAPRRAGNLTLTGTIGYFHPLPDDQALVVGSRTDQVGEGINRQSRSWVQVELLDVSDVDAPRIVGNWERPWSADDVGSDHHAFTYWPERHLAMWGVHNTQFQTAASGPNHAVVLNTQSKISEVAVPQASKPNEVPSPCPAVEVTDPDARNMVGPNGVVLECRVKNADDVEWPRYQCMRVDRSMVARFAPGNEDNNTFFLCSPAPEPTVSRVLVVSGTPILLTDQTLEALDPTTFASTAIAYHPTSNIYPFF